MTNQEPTANGCAAHQCCECGRFVASANVRHWAIRGANGHCADHGPVRVLCVRIGKRNSK